VCNLYRGRLFDRDFFRFQEEFVVREEGKNGEKKRGVYAGIEKGSEETTVFP